MASRVGEGDPTCPPWRSQGNVTCGASAEATDGREACGWCWGTRRASGGRLAVDIIQALDDRHLFQPHFLGESWLPWRSFLKALFALPMLPDDLARYQECTGRTNPPSRPFV